MTDIEKQQLWNFILAGLVCLRNVMDKPEELVNNRIVLGVLDNALGGKLCGKDRLEYQNNPSQLSDDFLEMMIKTLEYMKPLHPDFAGYQTEEFKNKKMPPFIINPKNNSYLQ